MQACIAATGLVGLLLFVLLQVRQVMRRMHDMQEHTHLRPTAQAGMAAPQHSHAVVLGASWTGMLTAAVLAPYFRQVTVLERDAVDDLNSGQPRPGVAQGTQSHVVVRYAIAFVNTLLPSFEDALRAAGGRAGGDMGVDFGWFHRGQWRLRQPLGLAMWFASRPLIERTLRQTVLQVCRNVSLQDGVRAVGLVVDTKLNRVAGLRLTHRGAPEQNTVTADFIADCSGKQSHSAAWLAQGGWGQVPEQKVDSATFYASRRFARPAGAANHWAMAWHGDARGARQGHFAGAVTVEDHAVCVWGVQTGRPLGTDAASFAAFFANMGTGDLARHVQPTTGHRPETQPRARAFGAGPSLRRRYHALHRLPDNYVVLGDAVCATNPVFGLGLSLAASTVACLSTALAQRARGARRGHVWSMTGLGKEVATRVGWRTLCPWILTTSEEYRLPHTQGHYKNHPVVRLLQWYVDRAFCAAHHTREVDALVMQVVGLVAHPLRVFSPYLMLQVFKKSSRSFMRDFQPVASR